MRMGPMSLLPIVLSLYWMGVVTNARLKEAFLQSVLAGIPVAQIGPVVDRYVAALMERGLNQSMVQALQAHLLRGDRVILVTASFDLYVEKLADRLGIPTVVCTRAEIRDGNLTGRIHGANCYGPEKLQRVASLLAPGEWAASILYTDHHSDLPLLEKVSQGFLVNPDAKTRALLKWHKVSLFAQE